RATRLEDGRLRVEVPYRGADLMAEPLYSKGSAFTAAERRTFGLEGLLPETVSTIEQQARRVYANICRKTEPIERYIGLAALQDRNEHLYYRVLLDHLEELLPIVYTPTVGQASKEYSHIYRQGRGLWITPEHRGRIAGVLANWRFSNVRLAVVTDNQAILGIGDQGAGGIVIPVGKLSIYCAAAGIHPAEALPVSLDVGTDNRELLDDPLYLGWRRPRLRGADYDSLVEELVEAMVDLFPGVLLQWEDFSKSNAFALLERYRERLPSFNDDVQGTGAMTLAGVLTACRITGERLPDQRVVIVGGGAAGIGIGRQLRAAMASEGAGEDVLARAIAVLDSRGLIVDDREGLDAYKRELAWPAELASEMGLPGQSDLRTVVRTLRPTVLVGTSGQPGIFDEEMVRGLAAAVERPVVMPLSNPTANSEAQPEDLVRWTEGRALIGTGSPFAPVAWEGSEIRIGQGNNAFIFPGVGLGVLVAEARQVSDGMFNAAARALAHSVSDRGLDRGALYPRMSRLREVTAEVAAAVVRQAREEGLGRPIEDEKVGAAVAAAMWEPAYPELEPV
ncbi:MAG: NAD-dependent malic enzyme, partial [Thermoanaerobaculia bacterium]|nr:NAD-dependent malic enzyme [Thermoanaerobaculia bacterium]